MPEDHELMNLATIHWMRHRIDRLAVEERPLMLPRFEASDLFVDYSTLDLTMPFLPQSLPPTEFGEVLKPLVELCHRHQRDMPARVWTYRWFYYELLDRDGRLQPLCWIDPRLLCGGFDHERVARGPYTLPALPGEVGPIANTRDPGRAFEATNRFIAHWRQWERLWRSDGLLVDRSDGGWLSMLRFDARAARMQDREPFPEVDWWGGSEAVSDDQDGVGLLAEESNAGYPGLSWGMIPLYDRRTDRRVPRAMKLDLYRTSVFNPSAGPAQNVTLWEHMEGRFGLHFLRLGRQELRARQREARIVALYNAGMTKRKIATQLLTERLHPLDEPTAHKACLSTGAERERWETRAFETVRAMTRTLRRRGKIAARKPGRPKHQSG